MQVIDGVIFSPLKAHLHESNLLSLYCTYETNWNRERKEKVWQQLWCTIANYCSKITFGPNPVIHEVMGHLQLHGKDWNSEAICTSEKSMKKTVLYMVSIDRAHVYVPTIVSCSKSKTSPKCHNKDIWESNLIIKQTYLQTLTGIYMNISVDMNEKYVLYCMYAACPI